MPEENIMVAHLSKQMNRMEEKVDGIHKVITQMARTEERVTRLMEQDQKKTEWMLELQAKIHALQTSEAGKNAVTMRIERAVWAIFAAVIAYAVATYS